VKKTTTQRRWLSAALLALLIFVQVFTLNLFQATADTLTATCPLNNGGFEDAALTPWYLQVDEANGGLSWWRADVTRCLSGHGPRRRGL